MLKIYVVFMLSVLFLSGCGDNGNQTAGTTKVTLATQGTLQTGKALSGIEVTLQLPVGVTPKLAADGTVDSSVVKASGVLADSAGLFAPTYTPAAGASPGTLSFVLYSNSTSPAGFGTGEFATITLNRSDRVVDFATVSQNIAAGTTLAFTTDYKVTSFSLRDLVGAIVNNISVTFTTETI